MPPIIELKNISKCYKLGTIGSGSLREDISNFFSSKKSRVKQNSKEFWALKEISFEVNKGEVIGIIGHNGAGKSTLLKILSRITEPTDGQAILRGRVASLLEVGTGFHPELTGRENIYLNGTTLGMKKREIDSKLDEIIEFSGCVQFIDTPVKRYSSGMAVRLGFAVAAHLEPEILIIDEVLAVGDIAFQEKCLGKMKNVANQGKTVIFVSHQMAAIENLCPKCIFLQNGALIDFNKSEEIISKYYSSLFKNQKLALEKRKDRQGTGEITVTNFKVLNQMQETIPAIKCGEKVTFLFALNINKIFEGAITFSIGINDKLGNRITQLNNKTTKNCLDILNENCEIKLTIEKFILLPGSYTFNIFIAINGLASDWIVNAGSLTVLAADYYRTGVLPEAGQGFLLMDYNYELNEKKA